MSFPVSNAAQRQAAARHRAELERYIDALTRATDGGLLISLTAIAVWQAIGAPTAGQAKGLDLTAWQRETCRRLRRHVLSTSASGSGKVLSR